jgi:hypothetical protein
MNTTSRVVSNLIFCIQILLLFLIFVEDRISLPPVLQLAGRMHPLILHIPIGVVIFLIVLILFAPKAESAHSDTVIQIGLLLTSGSASVAALFGFFLSLQGEYGGDTLEQHKISGVILSWLCYILLLLYNSRVKRIWFLSLGAVSACALLLAGHTGSILTHGENFLFGPMSEPAVALTAENASAYHYAVAPILERKCYSCHNESKAKGRLVMTDIDRFKAGGENGRPWVEGDPEQSRMIKAFYLPLEHDEHMPPDGKPQLTIIEIEVLKAWIKSGADFDKKLGDFPDGDTLKVMIADLVSQQPVQETEKVYSFEMASEDVIEKMNTPFVSVSALYLNSPALRAEFYVRKEFDVKSLQQLKEIENQLVSLSLSKMPVTDADLSIVSNFQNLETLNLNFTKVTGEGLHFLNELKSLKSLSLSGTDVSARHLEPILKLPELRQLYAWSTNVNVDQRDSLSKKYPDVSIWLTQFSDQSVLRLSKPMLVNEGVIQQGEDIVFRHPMPGVTIRYTTDGSIPDSLNSAVYDDPFRFTKTTVVKAKGCKDGWFCSDMMEAICYVRGKTPDELVLINSPDPQYPGEGVQSLTDGRKGVADVLKEPSWLGYRKAPFAVGVTFRGKAPELNEIVLSYARNVGGYSLPPKEIEIWAGEDEKTVKLIKKFTPEQPKENGPLKVDLLSIPIPKSSYNYYKVVAAQVPQLPQWHNGKGERSWVFIDEIFFY